MKIYVGEKEINKDNVARTTLIADDDAYQIEKEVEINSLEQHEQEIRKQERLNVIAELEEWVDDIINILLFGKNLIDYEDLKQKLNEMKGV